MAKSKPPLVRLGEMTPGQNGDLFARLAERTRGARKDGKPFFTCRFADSDRTVTTMIWSDGPWFEACEKDWSEGACFKIRGVYSEHPTYGAQLELINIRHASEKDAEDGFDPLQLVAHTPFDVEAMYSELWILAESTIGDVPLRRLVLTLLTKTQKQLKRVPASAKHFYPYAGGLLEHTLSVTHSCMHLVDKYANHYPDLDPPINRDIVIAAAILHDLGRTLEFGDGLSFDRTVDGQLLGHVVLSHDLLRDTARDLGDVSPKLLVLLEHVILSHLELPAWGSPRLPLVPEAIILHHADDLDAKMEMFVRRLSNDTEPGPFTARDPILGKSLYKRPK